MISIIPSYVWLTLLASVFHAFSFTYTKQFLAHSLNRQKLAFYSQYAVGFLAVLLLPFVDLAQLWEQFWLVLSMCVLVLLGQTSYLNAMRHGDASFVVPMLGCKIFAVAGLSVLFFEQTYPPSVYLAGLGAFVSLFFLNDGKLHGSPLALFFVLLTCFFFALADIIVVQVLKNGMGGLELAVFVFVVPAVLLMPLSPVLFKNDWKVSKPFGKTLLIYAVAHFIGLIILMYAFKLSQEATMINIVQASRGFIAVGVVYVLARLGLSQMEKLTRKQLISRLVGGLLMFGSLVVAVAGI
ncbi:MAG: EamA family transporter [Cycloclasticus pugetii]|uniref:EamA family transporter n=1 Tax=Cycloclasticus pugetii TaxID=34068 RepID=UPI003A8DFC1A